MRDEDVVIVGAGAAGLSLAYRLCTGPPNTRPPRVTLVDAPPGPLRPPERTWCYWEPPGGDFDDVLTASWERLRVRGPGGEPVVGRPAGLRYKMLRSGDFEAFVARRTERCSGLRRVVAAVHTVDDAPGGAEVRGADAAGEPVVLRARWAFDSRPPRPLPPARTTLLQHFRGWFVRTPRPCFDPAVADLMDFRTPQPPRGLSFGYVLPFSSREALVEYTEFSPSVLGDTGYDRALTHYVRQVLGLERWEVTAVEQGVIPMTDARFPRRTGAAVFRIGTAGGATRPSTGYTFAAVQRQSRAVAEAWRRGRPPVPPRPHPVRARAMDAVLLRALAAGRVDGAAFFTGLFRQVPMERLLRFLDGRTRAAEDIAIGLCTPVPAMLRTVAELPWLRRRAPAPAEAV
ncbi:lycopene cyclase [Streptomyces sp. NA02950]|uniref:lycopene cyclase family protein n=1 Tax=Streptomyces sp. NA02950 TaxID=2742137 RepID=UPI0015918ACB|nr:lycopene cyclase family protein [Streptomyces sp. NA02950]QKV96478.1 lycopene cyclase [Streptomyces sp. NA02950]